MVRCCLFFTLAILGFSPLTGCQPHSPSANTVNEHASVTGKEEDQFEDKPSPHILDPQPLTSEPIAQHTYSVQPIAQTLDLPATSSINEYQQAYFSVIQPQQNPNEPNAQFDYLPINPDVIFVKTILNHFAETMALARIEQQYGRDQLLLHLANDIILSRQNESQLMQNWLSMQLINNNADPNQKMADSVAAQQEIDSIKHDMQQEMVNTVMSKNADRAFAETMIIHHKGSIALAQVGLKYGNDEKVRNLTNSLIDTQQAEIQLLQGWLKSSAIS